MLFLVKFLAENFYGGQETDCELSNIHTHDVNVKQATFLWSEHHWSIEKALILHLPRKFGLIMLSISNSK